MMNKINFYIPDFYYKFDLNIELIKTIKTHPEYFYDNIHIGAVYGSFPGAIWNGGRMMHGIASSENICNTIQAFNDLDIPVRFTFTNCLLDATHVYDTYCNLIMNAANNGKNEVLVNAPVLEEYLREKYPNFKYILSTTRCERDVNKINMACMDYDLVVADYRDNINDEFLCQLSHKEKIELLINAYCYPNCSHRQEHYKSLSQKQLNFNEMIACDYGKQCDVPSMGFYDSFHFQTVIKTDALYGKYIDMGFSNFKIEGRTLHTLDIIESYVYYLVKPEFKDFVRYQLIKYCWK